MRLNLFYNAKNCAIELDDTTVHYITFGSGSKTMVIIPGLGDSLRETTGAAVPLALYYKSFAKDYTVYVFSRKNKIPQGYTTKDMADDVATVLSKLNIKSAYVIGISQGGMIAQHLALNYQSIVKKLVLAVTICRTNATMNKVMTNWITLAEKGDYKSIFADTSENTYSEKKLKTLRFFYPWLTKMTEPKNLESFIIQAKSCMSHDCYDSVSQIACPTFVIGGAVDKIVGGESSAEIAQLIKDSKLKVYENLGHSAYEEAEDFQSIVLDFFGAQQ